MEILFKEVSSKVRKCGKEEVRVEEEEEEEDMMRRKVEGRGSERKTHQAEITILEKQLKFHVSLPVDL